MGDEKDCNWSEVRSRFEHLALEESRQNQAEVMAHSALLLLLGNRQHGKVEYLGRGGGICEIVAI